MRSFLGTLLCIVSLLVISACSTVTIEDYADNKPKFVAESFFNGKLTAHGIIKNRSGQVIRYFNASIIANWKEGVGILDERFTFDDGEQQTRVWKLVPRGGGTYTASAGDVVGEAQVEAVGNSLFLDYVLRIPYGDGTIDVHIDDRMYLVSDTVLLNESVMSKWGFRVGQITLVIQKRLL